MLITTMAVLAGMAGPDTTLRVRVAPGESLHVEVQGQGTTVVLIPGLFGSAHAYRAVVARLTASGHRTIVVEPLGLGQSSRPRHADYSLSAQAERVAAVLDSLHVGSAVVVSHAVGTGVALRLALARPALVRSIVSLNGGVAESAASPSLRRTVSLAPLVRIIGQGGIRSRVRSGLVNASGDTTWVSDDVVRAYTRHATADLGGTLGAFRAMVQSRERVLLAGRLGEISCPVLVLIGTAPHDGALDGFQLDRMRTAIASLRVESIAGAGSYLHEERPDLVAGAIARIAAGGRETPIIRAVAP